MTAFPYLVDFLLDIPKQVRIEKGGKIDFQTVTDFLDGGNGDGIVPSADHII